VKFICWFTRYSDCI